MLAGSLVFSHVSGPCVPKEEPVYFLLGKTQTWCLQLLSLGHLCLHITKIIFNPRRQLWRMKGMCWWPGFSTVTSLTGVCEELKSCGYLTYPHVLKKTLKIFNFIDFKERKEAGREKHGAAVLLIYSFIGWFLYVPWLGTEPTTLYIGTMLYLSYLARTVLKCFCQEKVKYSFAFLVIILAIINHGVLGSCHTLMTSLLEWGPSWGCQYPPRQDRKNKLHKNFIRLPALAGLETCG